jgi:hypothetical protein
MGREDVLVKPGQRERSRNLAAPACSVSLQREDIILMGVQARSQAAASAFALGQPLQALSHVRGTQQPSNPVRVHPPTLRT